MRNFPEFSKSHKLNHFFQTIYILRVVFPAKYIRWHLKPKKSVRTFIQLITTTNQATQMTDIKTPDQQIDQVQSALAFKTELVAVPQKTLFNSISAVKGDLWMVLPEDIRVIPDFNVRIKNDAYYAHIRALADSMKENGYYADKPIAGYGAYDGKKPVIYTTEGHCRMEAVALAISEGADITEIPVVIKDKSTNMEDLTVAMARTSHVLKLSPIELAIVCKRLATAGWKEDRIATSIGMTSEYVNQLLTLAGSPKLIRDMVESGQATAAVAIAAIRTHGSDAVNVMSESLSEAKASGKNKVTAKFLPAQMQKKAFAKAAPRMYVAIEQVRSHKSFSKLPDDLKEMIDEIISNVSTASVRPQTELALKSEEQAA